jgi:upstream activation factor subunit UAF30
VRAQNYNRLLRPLVTLNCLLQPTDSVADALDVHTPGGTKLAKRASATSTQPSNAFQKPLQPSPELAAVVGGERLSRAEVVSKVWDYIKSHNLQNPENRREIVADDKLRKVFDKDKVTMFEMNKHLAKHLK